MIEQHMTLVTSPAFGLYSLDGIFRSFGDALFILSLLLKFHLWRVLGLKLRSLGVFSKHPCPGAILLALAWL